MTTISNPTDPVVQAIFLRGHARLMAVGMRHSSLTQTQVMEKAGEILGKKFKRGQMQMVADELNAFIKANQKGAK